MDIARWLTAQGLDKYIAIFRDAEIDGAALPHLTDADLREMGVPVGPRRKLLAAIATLESPSPLHANDSTSTTAVRPARRTEAERRQLTVLFADLVGSTPLAQQLDPEELRDIIHGYQDMAAGAITRFQGHVAKFMGDGVLGYFGWPTAHEDDPERAVRAGLALVESIARDPRRLAVRIGIATGEVVVGDVVGEGSAREESAVGETLNLAARLQQQAEPGAVIIAASTRELIGETFELEPLGAIALKGISGSVDAWRVRRERQLETRFEASRGRYLRPLVGRDQELAMALGRFEQARSGEGQVVLLRAEAGIGKSRLIAELRARIEPQSTPVISFQGSPHHTSSALYPVIQHIQRAAGIGPDDPPDHLLQRLESWIVANAADPARALPLLARVLTIDGKASIDPEAWDRQQIRTQTLAVLADLVTSRARSQPLILIFEDLHWFDPTSLELLDLIVARIESQPVFIIVTMRPEMPAPWEGRGHVTLLSLNRLGRRQIEAQIASIDFAGGLTAEVAEQIVAKSDGVPLFVEELTRAALELQPGSGGLVVPSSLRASLLARLDRLPDAREVAQIGAALGREFEFEQLAAVMQQDDSVVAAALAELQRAEIVFPRGTPPRTRWTFKHALIQDAAYETQLRGARATLHRRIAETIASRFPALAEAQPEVIARHWQAAGLREPASRCWHLAGNRAITRLAGAEASRLLATALEQCDESVSARQSLAIRVSMAEAHAISGQLTEAKQVASRAIQMARDLHEPAELARAAILVSLSEVNSTTTRNETITLLEDALAACPGEDSQTRIPLLTALSRSLTMVGRFADATRVADRAVALARLVGDLRGLAEALEVPFLTPVSVPAERIPDYVRMGDELAATSLQAGQPVSLARVYTQQFYWSMQLGDIHRARDFRARHEALTRSWDANYLHVASWQMQAMEAILAGDLTRAESKADAAYQIGLREQAGAHGSYGIQMFTIRREQARLAEVASVFKRIVDEAPAGSAWEPGFALIASDLGFEAPARRILDKHAANGFQFPADAMRSATLAFFAESAVRLGDRRAATQILRELLPYEHMTITIGMTVVCYGAASRFLGALADLLDDRETARIQFDRALEINTRMGAVGWLAHTQLDYAKALRRWGSADDVPHADQLIGEARTIIDRLGHAALKQKLADVGA